MENLKDKKVGLLVADNYRFADVFKKYGIDFCCGGGITVEEACRRKGLDHTSVVEELEAAIAEKREGADFNKWQLDYLIDHIVNIHHEYVRENIPLLIAYSDKVAAVHGDAHPETIEINRKVHDLYKELMPHMEKEEVVLFPFIKRLLANGADSGAPFGTIENPIKAMMADHDAAGDIMQSISELSADFTPPAGACTTYRVLYLKLLEFQNDLHQHIHLENNILFPKAVQK